MELPFNVMATVVAAVIFILIVVGLAYMAQERGKSLLDVIWDFGSFIKDLKGNP